MDTKIVHPLVSTPAIVTATMSRLTPESYEVRVAFWAQAEREVISAERDRENWRRQNRDQDPRPFPHWSTFEQMVEIARATAWEATQRAAMPGADFIASVVKSQLIAREIDAKLDEVRSQWSRNRDDPTLRDPVYAIEQIAFSLSEQLNTALEHLKA